MTSTLIDLPFLELTDRRNTVVIKSYIELFDTYLQYMNVADYSLLNLESQLWEDVKSNYRWTRRRSEISNVDMFFDNKESKWAVTLDFKTSGQSVAWYFESQKDSLFVYNNLSHYLINQI